MARMRAHLVLVAVGALAAGCGHSTLIRRDDPVLDDSQRHLVKTAAAVEALAAPPAERLLFMQAEGFYRYRFQAPPRSAASTVAVIAAAITDVPAFQAWRDRSI